MLASLWRVEGELEADAKHLERDMSDVVLAEERGEQVQEHALAIRALNGQFVAKAASLQRSIC
jgi:hypothetical protein